MSQTLLHGDCFELMSTIPDGSVDMVCTDMPYGVTRAPWDYKVDLTKLWRELYRIGKPNAAFVMFASGKFTYELAQSNWNDFRYRYTWHKQNFAATGFLNANRRPLVASEDILVFYRKQPRYNPQRDYVEGKGAYSQRSSRNLVRKTFGSFYGKAHDTISESTDGKRYPTDVLTFAADNPSKRKHSTQKPLKLLEFLIKTYTDQGELVLDPFMGSGSCGVACLHTGRNFLGIERDNEFFDIARNWLRETSLDLAPSWY